MFSLLGKPSRRKPHKIIAIHIPKDMQADIERMYADKGYTDLVWQRENNRLKPEEQPSE